jgi:hypothetical protein
MSNENVVYSTVSASIIADSLKSVSAADKADKALDKAEGTIWNAAVYSCAPVFLQVESGKLEGKDNIKDAVKECITNALALVIEKIPETFVDKNGKEQPLKKKDGTVKWSSWPFTLRHMAYASDITKVILNGLSKTLMPDSTQIATRLSILALCQGTETLISSIDRTVKSLQGFLSKVEEPADVYHAATQVDTLVVSNQLPLDQAKGLVRKLNAILSACDAAGKKDVLKEMESLLVHFE